jgi:hypothetical protein
MRVSINYPWGNEWKPDGTGVGSCGWDFGTAPAGWGYPGIGGRGRGRP